MTAPEQQAERERDVALAENARLREAHAALALQAGHYERRWESTVVEAQRQARRADELEQQAVNSAWNKMRLGEEITRLRKKLAAAEAENTRLRARLDDYGSPILGPVPVPPPDLGSIRMAEARDELERTGTTDKPWAAGRGLCPEKTGCPSGLLALFELTKRGHLPVHSGEYGGPCAGSGKKPSVVLQYAPATAPTT